MADPGRAQSGRRDTGEREGRKEALGEGGLGPGTAFILALWGGWGAGGAVPYPTQASSSLRIIKP